MPGAFGHQSIQINSFIYLYSLTKIRTAGWIWLQNLPFYLLWTLVACSRLHVPSVLWQLFMPAGSRRSIVLYSHFRYWQHSLGGEEGSRRPFTNVKAALQRDVLSAFSDIWSRSASQPGYEKYSISQQADLGYNSCNNRVNYNDDAFRDKGLVLLEFCWSAFVS